MISVIVCSIDPAKAATLHENIVQTIGIPFEFRAFDNREARKGICAVYNACAREARYELLCFVHEDVRFLTQGWGAILAERLMQPRCGVVGFAGGTMKLRGMTAWCLDERDARTAYAQPDAAGRMIRHDDNPAGEDFSRVACLDGFCLFVRREVWKSVLFDETLLRGFHGYDLDFTLATACKYENWVCHTVRVEHLSAGAYSPAWREALEIFHAKWHDRLPFFAAGPVPAEKAIEALEYKANALWWRKLIRLGLCTPEEARRAVAGLLRQRPFDREGWKTAFKWARFGIKTIEFGNKTPEIGNKNTDSSINIMKTYAIISTEKGDMKAELYTDETPGTVKNFTELAEHNFYDGLTFHRVIPDFVIQGGCPKGDGTGGPGYTIKCETSAPRQYHVRGVLSMAHAGRDTGGSQFFICHNRENTQHLDGRHTCFGKVVEGLDVIDDIRPGDRILSIRIVRE